MRLKITHRTEYLYERFVHHSIQELRLTPQDTNNQLLDHWKITAPSKMTESIDAFGNVCHVFVLDNNYSGMLIEARGEVFTKDQYVFSDPKDAVSPLCLLQQTTLTEPSAEMIHNFSTYKDKDLTPEDMLKIGIQIQNIISYEQGATNTKTTAADAWELKKGVCQDQAHVMLGLCRYLKIPARYVSGFFYAENMPNLASHAWVDVCLDSDNAIWHSIDITNGCFSNEHHIRLAIGRDYAHVAPVKGIRSGGGAEELITKITIEKC